MEGKIARCFWYRNVSENGFVPCCTAGYEVYTKTTPLCLSLLSSIRLVFRDPSDAEEKLTLPTPSPQLILNNINKFLTTWKDISHENQAVLTEATIKEIGNLRKHVHKGCLSYIPVGCGSERNENLHKCLQQAASKGRVGVALAVARLTFFLYKWNEKQAARRKGSKAKVLPPVTSRKAELLNGQTSLTKEKFGIGISKERTNCMAFLPAAYEQCSNSLSEMQDIMGRAFDDTLENVLSSYNFTRVQVAPDGDCLFSSVIFQLKQMVSSGNSELISHLKAIEFHTLCLISSLLCL